MLLFKNNFILLPKKARYSVLFSSQLLDESSQCLRLLCNHLNFFFSFSPFQVCIAQIDFYSHTHSRPVIAYAYYTL